MTSLAWRQLTSIHPQITPHDRQIELEEWCTRIGGYRATTGKWQKGASGFLTQQFSKLFLTACLKLWRQSRNGATRYGTLWSLMKDEQAVAQVCLESLHFLLSNAEDGMGRNRLAAALGQRAEFVLFLNHPHWKGSRHVKALRSVNGRNISMEIMRRRLMAMGFGTAGSYTPLRSVEKIALGTLFLEIINRTTGLLTFETIRSSKNRSRIVIRFSSGFWLFLDRWKNNLQEHRPIFLPMTVPPMAWGGLADGGYLKTPTALSSVPWERFKHAMKNAHPSVLGSINYLQSIAFQRNGDQVELLAEVWDAGHGVGKLPPRDRMEKPDKQEYIKRDQLSDFWPLYYRWVADQQLNPIRTKFIHALTSWKRLDDHVRLWFVWHMDYRGRLYQRSSGINYMGSDPFRTMLRFDRSCPMQPYMHEFAYALSEAADVGGSMNTRVQWMEDNHHQLQLVGSDPLSYRAFWEGRKKPWRFVELCLEYACWADDPTYKTHTIFSLDQTTSAYGHVACLLRSGWLARLTNVTGHEHGDVYMEVQLRTIQLLKADVAIQPELKHEAYCKAWWIEHGISRELVKPTVMPLVYRRSYLSMVQTIEAYLYGELNNFLNPEGVRVIDLAHCLARYLHLATRDVLPGVSKLHKWLVQVAKLQMKAGHRPYWLTPNGLLVESYTSKKSEETYFLEVAGAHIHLQTLADDTPNGMKLDHKKSTTQLSADFVHSYDAAYLQRFVWHWGQTFKTPIVSLHDCIGVNLDQIPLARRELNDQFSRFYSIDYLTMMQINLQKELKVEIPSPPLENTLDVQRIGENPHLFG